MDLLVIDNYIIRFRPFDMGYIDKLLIYFEKLSSDSKKRFGPHPFTRGEIIRVSSTSDYKLFIAVSGNTNIVAYTIVKSGWVESDSSRLTSYGLIPSDECSLAPSVADGWQSRGIGSKFFKYVVGQIKSNNNVNRIVLWGGVQSGNSKAIGFFKSLGFMTLGEFKHNGKNLDMFLQI